MADKIIRPNQWVEILATSSKTTAQSVTCQMAEGSRGAYFFIDVTTDAASASVTPSIEIIDPGGDNDTEAIITWTAIADIGHDIKLVYPAASETAAVTNLELQAIPLPGRFNFAVAVADADALEYGVRAYGLP
tara:strand:- start:936 stop:1334 length:399 start_codon:yes stop_codon:yes gene_type:complete